MFSLNVQDIQTLMTIQITAYPNYISFFTICLKIDFVYKKALISCVISYQSLTRGIIILFTYHPQPLSSQFRILWKTMKFEWCYANAVLVFFTVYFTNRHFPIVNISLIVAATYDNALLSPTAFVRHTYSTNRVQKFNFVYFCSLTFGSTVMADGESIQGR